MYFKLQFGSPWAQWIITNVWDWQSPKSVANRVQYAKIMLEKHPELEHWDRVALVVKFTLGGALSISYALCASPESNIVSIVNNTGRNQSQKRRKRSTVGPQQVTI